MSETMSEVPRLLTLPNGLEVAFQSHVETRHFYRDIFLEEVYLGGPLRLPPGAVVFDVGANIGLFTVFAALRSPGASIWSFEPAPPLFELLRFNAARYAPRAKLFNRGVADHCGRAELLFYPGSSGMSSFHPDLAEEREALRAVIENEAREGVEAARALLGDHLEDYLEDRLRGVTFSCPLTTVSQVMADENVNRVDLLKIDVQKSEMSVLAGIAEEDWPKIRQVAVEVHDLDGRLERLTHWLEERGHDVEVEQETLYEGSDVYLLYGQRREMGTRRSSTADNELAPRPCSLLVWSATTADALENRAAALAHWAREHAADGESAEEAASVASLAATLQCTRPAESHRGCAVVRDYGDATKALAEATPQRLLRGRRKGAPPAVAFLFPGLGNHHPAMAADLLRAEPDLRREVTESCEILRPLLGMDLGQHFEGLASTDRRRAEPDLRQLFGRGASGSDGGAGVLRDTRLAQPALFVIELALARLWMRWGIEPEAMAGYSLGEFVAACLAGVFTREDALRLVAERARLIAELPEGAMLAVGSAAHVVDSRLLEGLSITADVSPEVTVVGGPPRAVAELERELASEGTICRRLDTSHAFHCDMLRPAVAPFVAAVSAVPREVPRIPWVSNVTGTWITAEQAVDPEYWGRHIVRPVRFSSALGELWRHPRRVLLEVGPGGTLGAWALQHPAAQDLEDPMVLSSLPHGFDGQFDHEILLRSLGRLWVSGARIDWDAFHAGRIRALVELPLEVLEDGVGESETAAGGVSAGVQPSPEPAGELEAQLASLWCSILHKAEVGRHEDFFELGGDSLRATRLITACQEELGVRLTLRELFDAPTLGELGQLLVGRGAGME